MLKRMKKGFTLVELIVVVVVLGIIAALAIATFTTVREESANSVALRTAEGIARNANAIAAFDGVATNTTHITSAGSETLPATGNGSTFNTDTVTIKANGNTGVACVEVSGTVAVATAGAC